MPGGEGILRLIEPTNPSQNLIWKELGTLNHSFDLLFLLAEVKAILISKRPIGPVSDEILTKGKSFHSCPFLDLKTKSTFGQKSCMSQPLLQAENGIFLVENKRFQEELDRETETLPVSQYIDSAPRQSEALTGINQQLNARITSINN